MTHTISNNKRIAKNTLMLYLRMGVSMIVSLYTSRIVLNTLGIEDYGIYSVVAGIISMFTFLNSALSGATSRFITFELGKNYFVQLNKTFSAAFINHIILALIILFLAETIGLWFLYHKLVIPDNRLNAAFWVYQCSIASTILGIIQVPFSSLIMAHEKMGIYAYLSIFDVVLKLVLVILLSYVSTDKLIFWAFCGVFVTILYNSFNYIYCYKHFKESHISIHKEIPLYKRLFIYSFWDFLGSMSSLAQGQGLNMMLNIFFGPTINAARGIAMTIQGAVVQFSSNFTIASKPQIIKLYADNNIKGMLELVYNSSKLSFFLLYLFALPLCLEIKYVLTLWLGEYPDYTIIFTILILINSLTWSFKTHRTTMVHATGHIKLSNLTVGVILCSTLPISYLFLINGFSAVSVFIITIVITLLAELVACFVLKRYLDYSVKDYFKNVYGKCLLISCFSFIAPYIVHTLFSESFLRLCLVSLTSLISVSFFAYKLGLDDSSRTKIISFIKNRIAQKKRPTT